VHNKKARKMRASFEASKSTELFDFVFFVQDVLACDRVKLHKFELVWCRFLVFVCRVEVTGFCSRNELNFITHGLSSLKGKAITPVRL
jgi:hypothetical protein